MRPPDHYYDAPSQGKGRYPQWFAHFFFGLVRIVFTPLFRYRAYNADFVKDAPPEKSYILAGNHRSALDPVFLISVVRPKHVRFIAKEEFFSNAFFSHLFALVGAFPLKRGSADMKAIKRSVAMLKRGECLGIFPEGTRVRDASQPSTYHEGIALIAHLSKADVVPVRIWGNDRIRPAGSKRMHFPRITLRFGEPLSFEPYEALPKEERFTAFTTAVMDALYALENPREPSAHKPASAPQEEQPADKPVSGLQ